MTQQARLRLEGALDLEMRALHTLLEQTWEHGEVEFMLLEELGEPVGGLFGIQRWALVLSRRWPSRFRRGSSAPGAGLARKVES